MKLEDVSLPALRSDLQLVRTDHPKYPGAVQDPVLQQRIGLDEIGCTVAAALQEPRTALEVIGFAHGHGEDRLAPGLLLQHVRHLQRHGLFEGRRAAQNRAAAALPPDPERTDDDRAFAYAEGLQHACQACGSCCSATDVGPIPDEVATAILAHDWRQEIVGLEDNEAVFRREGDLRLMAMRDDQCIFLGADKLCRVHKELGVEAKPTPCRQFPFVFARTGDALQVSLSTECRAWWKARQAAKPPSEDEDELRALLAIGAPVHDVPPTLRLDPGLLIGRDAWLELVADTIAAVRNPDPRFGVLGPIAAYGKGIEQRLMTLMDPIDAEERPIVSTAAWQTAFPDSVRTLPDASENFEALLERFDEEMRDFTTGGAAVAMERGRPWLSARLSFLGRAATALCGGEEPRSFRFVDETAAKTILGDVLVSGLQAHEPVRRGATLRAGLAHLSLRALLTLFGAISRAKDACRVEVTVQDLVDSMVTIGKMLRERAVTDLLSGHESVVISLFLTNLEVFSYTAMPRLEMPGVIR